MNKTLLVARREYVSTVKRKGFIIATLGLPLMIAVFYGIVVLVTMIAMRQTREKAGTMGLVDESGLVDFALMEKIKGAESSTPPDMEEVPPMLRQRIRTEAMKMAGKTDIRRFKTLEEAAQGYLSKDIRGYYVVPADFLQRGVIELKIKKGGFGSDDSPAWNLIQQLLSASLVEGKLEPPAANRVWIPARLKTQAIDDAGKPDQSGQYSQITSFAIPYAFMLLFIISVMTGAGYLMQGVAEEKENRVIEILLSSIKPEQLLAGKVLGLCGAGLTQILAWITIVVVPAIFVLPFLSLRWDQLVAALIFFPLGYLVFGSLMGGTASLGNNFRESQQASMVWTLSAILPLMMFPAIIAQPNGTLARVLSYIPLTAPGTVMLRIGATRVPWWDIALSAAILIASLYLIIRLSAKLFRMGTLMYGKKPSMVEIVRWLRAS